MRKTVPSVAFVAIVGATAIALWPLCSLLHRCGCELPWAGGTSRCNVHAAEGPHCPWCEHPVLGGLVTGGTLGAEVLTLLAVRRRGGSTLRGAFAAIAALPAGFVVFGAAAWLATDYPHFLVADARARIGLPKGPIRCVATPASRVSAACCPPR